MSNASPIKTTATPKPISNINSSIRIILCIAVAIPIAIFILLWEGSYIPKYGIPPIIGSLVFVPLMAVGLIFGSNSLIQQLSCSQIQWLDQLKYISFVPIPYFIQWVLLRYLPILRWPIEGLVQQLPTDKQKSISSAFYTFFTTIYIQAFLGGISQMCP